MHHENVLFFVGFFLGFFGARGWAGLASGYAEAAAGFLDGLDGAFRCTLQAHGYPFGNVTALQQLYPYVRVAYQAGVCQFLVIYGGAQFIELVSVDVFGGYLEAAEAVELRQALHERVLAAFKPRLFA